MKNSTKFTGGLLLKHFIPCESRSVLCGCLRRCLALVVLGSKCGAGFISMVLLRCVSAFSLCFSNGHKAHIQRMTSSIVEAFDKADVQLCELKDSDNEQDAFE